MKYLILLLIPVSVFADHRGVVRTETTENTYIENTYVTEVTEVTNVTNSNGVALGIAQSQINFDLGTWSWQAGIGIGNFKGDNAYAFGFAKRTGRDMLINGSIGREGSDNGYGLGATVRF